MTLIRWVVAILFLVSVLIQCQITEARYLSPSNPEKYSTSQDLRLKMNKLTSNLKSYPYYKGAPYNTDLADEKSEGSFAFKLSGNGQYTAMYPLKAMYSNECLEASHTKLTADQVNDFIDLIKDQYRAHFYVDGLPIGELKPSSNGGQYILLGYPIGFTSTDENGTVINVEFWFQYKQVIPNSDDLFYLIHVSVTPRSFIGCNTQYPNGMSKPMELFRDTAANVSWTYSTNRYNSTDVNPEDRWDIYYPHAVAIESTSAVIGFLITVVECLFLALVLWKIFRGNESLGFIQLGDSGWKSIYADVFRSPNRYMTFSILIGTGMQIAVSSFMLMLFYVAGLLSISNPGSFRLALILIFAFCGLFSGYASMRTYIMLGGSRKRHNALLNATLIPLILLILIFISKFQLWSNHYLSAPSATEVIFVICMWLFVSIPTSLLSSYFVNTWPPAEYPFKPNHIPRLIPKAVWYTNHYFHSLIFGFLPFAVIFAQINFELDPIFNNFHVNNSYDLCIAFILMIINIIVINMLITYYQLSREDYNWWWRSILGPACTSIYIFIYLLVYGYPRVLGGTGFYYFMYSFIISLFSALFFSSIGFLGNLWFVKKIYSTLHFE
ncbi:TM9 protein C [Heterostelium album PN500]|uniref:Transmembrane 9 superfamily member n=1 Tax=Heterostelium pallidum (strain ATCC 26659 / Pp 5 / PN500) TaxID=670386 RepID=D3BA06_HETP5|nr:TM9 protein C [Heterostelium album PN500]EFA81393.1 TM9 protein C [Heterostelium album PN500]|eukprot:XP_020433511.1 TM9 protein C [Heterostelium album PN500]